eukprot:g29692.t1
MIRATSDIEQIATEHVPFLMETLTETPAGRQEFLLNGSPPSLELSATPLPTTQLRWRPHGAASKTQSVLVSVNAEFDGQIMQWHIKSGKCLHSITEKGNQIFCLDYFSDGSQFATAGKDRLLRETAGHSNRIFSLKYHPEDPNIILSGGWDNTVQVWDTRKGISVKSLWNAYICGDAVDISSDGRQILTGSWRTENSLQIWDFASGKVAQTIDWASASSKMLALQICVPSKHDSCEDAGSSMILAGGSQENEAKFFLRQPGAMPVPFGALVSMPKPVFTVDWSISSKMAAVGSSDGQVRVLEVL